MADTNNDKKRDKIVQTEKCETYSLRPRIIWKSDDNDDNDEDEDNKNNNYDEKKYEEWKPRTKCNKTVKQKTAPLSKYRRRTANARERSRMREINEGFEALRRALPHLASDNDNSNEKLTKISTLKMAMKYITTLNDILQGHDVESGEECFLSECTVSSTTTTSSTNSDSYQSTFKLPNFSDRSFSSDFPHQFQPSFNQILSPLLPLSKSSSHPIIHINNDSNNSCNNINAEKDNTCFINITTATISATSLKSGNDYSLVYDFVRAATMSAAAAASIISSSTNETDSIVDCGSPKITFDENEYVFDTLNYLTSA